MTQITTEMMLSIAMVVLTILAIAVFIVSGAGLLFYAIFAIAVVLMLGMWYTISRTTTVQAAPAKVSYSRKNKTTNAKKRSARKHTR